MQLISVGDAHIAYCNTLAEELRAHGFRVEVDESSETVGNKIRKAVKMKHPYVLVIGDKEMGSSELMVRTRGEKEAQPIAKDAFVAKVKQLISEKSLGL